MVFGTFDGLHDGHRFFLREAKKQGDWLIAIVAPDGAVEFHKGRLPRRPLKHRIEALRAERLADKVVPGDARPGSWQVIKTRRPNTVAVGHDQFALEKSLREFIEEQKLPITVVRLSAHKPDALHSSLRQKK